MIIVIGSGDYVVSGLKPDGHGVGIGLLKGHGGEIGRNAAAEVVCSIRFKDIKSARMFQDQVNIACLRMNNYEVKNSDKT